MTSATQMEEVATVEIYTMNRPSMPLTAACALSASPLVPAATSVAAPVLAAERAPVSRVHQAQIQAELARVLVLAGGIDSSTEFQGFSVSTDSKRYTDGDGGVPPRGRPV
jgi:hypothetical protein